MTKENVREEGLGTHHWDRRDSKSAGIQCAWGRLDRLNTVVDLDHRDQLNTAVDLDHRDQLNTAVDLVHRDSSIGYCVPLRHFALHAAVGASVLDLACGVFVVVSLVVLSSLVDAFSVDLPSFHGAPFLSHAVRPFEDFLSVPQDHVQQKTSVALTF
jgi:hypothetical protein